MLRHAILYGIALAGLSLLLAWMDFRHVARMWSTEFYVTCVALLFAGLGIWLGARLTRQTREEGKVNEAALRYLGISRRECEVLAHLAEGCSNKVIARRLSISPNTVKSHVAQLFEKLDAANRTEAIHKARGLRILP